jgi:hypothetical protein
MQRHKSVRQVTEYTCIRTWQAPLQYQATRQTEHFLMWPVAKQWSQADPTEILLGVEA